MKTVTITQLLNQYLKKIKGKPNRLGEERQKALKKKKKNTAVFRTGTWVQLVKSSRVLNPAVKEASY